MDAATIRLLVVANSQGVAAGLLPGLAALKAFETKTAGTVGRIKTIFAGMSTGAKVLGGVAVGAVAVGTALRGSVKDAIDFEAAFALVKKTVEGTPGELAMIRDELLEMSKIMPSTAVDLAHIAEQAGQLGVPTKEVAAFTEVIAKLAATSALTVQSSAMALAQFLNITGTGASTFAEAAKEAGDAITFLGNNTATTEPKILKMAHRMAVAGAQFGISKEAILGSAAALSAWGLEAEQGGTAMSRLLISLNDAVVDGGPLLEEYANIAGMTAEQFQELARSNPDEALRATAAGLGETLDQVGTLTPAMDALGFSGIRMTQLIVQLGLRSEFFNDTLLKSNDAVADGTATQTEYAKILETVAAQLDIFTNRMTALKISVGTAFLPAIFASVLALGDAIEKVVQILGPLASEVFGLFANAASAAGLFYDVIGRPALGAAVVTLIGMVDVLSGLLGVFNGLGESGAILAGLGAAIYAFSGSSAAATAYLTVSLYGVSGGAKAAAVGMKTFTLSLLTNPIFLAVAALAMVGKALYDAGEKAEQAGDVYRDGFKKELEESDFSGVVEGIGQVNSRMRELEGVDKVSDGFGGGWDSWGTAIKSVGQILTPFTENTVINARAELEELGIVVDELQVEPLTAGVAKLATQFGLTNDEALELVQKLGLVDEAADYGAQGMDRNGKATNRVVEAFAAGTEEAIALADAMNITVQALQDGELSLTQIADAFGISEEQAAKLVGLLPDINMDDLQDGDIEKIDALGEGMRETGEAAGVSTGEIIDYKDAIKGLVEAHATLDTAISNANATMDAFSAKQVILDSATAAWNTSLTAIGEEGIPALEGAWTSMNDLVIAYSATGASTQEVTAFQLGLYESLLNTAGGSKEAQAEMQRLLEKYGLVPTSVITDVVAETAEANEDLDEFREDLELTPEELRVQAYLDGHPEVQAAIDDLMAKFGAYEEADPVTEVEAETKQAEEDLQKVLDAAQSIDNPFEAEITVDSGNSEIHIDTLSEAIARIRSKTVYVDVVTSGSSVNAARNEAYRSRASADGNIFMANGGMIRESSGRAKIYSPTAQHRIHSEPETGGEAYIPLAAGKRPRSLAIWRETGRRLGVMTGGSAGDLSGVSTALGTTFAAGGITTETFSSGSGGLPTVLVNVAINAESLASMEVDLSPVNAALKITADRIAVAEAAARNLNREIPQIGVELYDMNETAAEVGRSIVDTMRPSELVSAFAEATGMAESEIREMFGSWDGHVASAIAALEGMGLDSDQIFAAIAEMGFESGGAILTAFEEAGLGVREEAARMGEEMLTSLDSADFLDEFSRISGWAKDEFVDWLAVWDDSTNEMVAELREAGLTTDEIFAEMFSNQDAIDRVREAGLDVAAIFEQMFWEGADAADHLDLAIGFVADSINDVDSATRRATDAFEIMTGVARDALDAELDMRSAVLRVQDAIEGTEDDGPGIFGFDTEDAIRNYELLVRAGDEMRKYALTLAGSGISAAEAVANFDEMRIAFSSLALQAGLSAEEVETLTGTLFDVPIATIIEIAVEASEADIDIEAFRTAMEELAAGIYEPKIGADATEADLAIQKILEDLGLISAKKTTATIDADVDESVGEDVGGVKDDLDDIDGKEVEATIDVDSGPADDTIDDFNDDFDDVDDRTAEPTIDVDSGPADDVIDDFTDDLEDVDDIFTQPEVDLEAGQFFNSLNAVQNALRNLDGMTATTYVNVTTIGSEVRQLDPIVDYAAAAGAVTPKIVADGSYSVVFGERGTGGEAYIPLANDFRRPRALRLWEETGRRLGVMGMANGGLVNSGLTSNNSSGVAAVVLAPKVSVDVHPGPGMDEAALARKVGDQIRGALADAGRDLQNMR